jgi:hypothetical protein
VLDIVLDIVLDVVLDVVLDIVLAGRLHECQTLPAGRDPGPDRPDRPIKCYGFMTMHRVLPHALVALAVTAGVAVAPATSDAGQGAAPVGAAPGASLTRAFAAPLDGLPDELPAGAAATRGTTPVDVVSVYEAGTLSASVRDRALRAATDASAAAVVGRSASVGMRQLTRGATVVQAAPGGGWQFPMGLTVLPPEAVLPLMGSQVSAVVARGELVMGQTSADLRGARAGDVAHLVAADGGLRQVRVGAVLPDADIGGAELLAAEAVADALGVTREFRVLIWGALDRSALDEALRARDLVNSSVRIRRSWDPPDPDSTIGLAETKALLGEFAYRVSTAGTVSVAADWESANITDRITYDGIAVRTRCHRVVADALQGALTDVAAAGLASGIDVANANAYGGCYYPRFNRVTGQLGFLSRHSWGQAFDTNTTTNAQGAVPQLDCRIVQIFRRWGFAWGGNFIRPDGMHFEYVGERRDTVPYPSRFCPTVAAASQPVTRGAAQPAGIDDFFSADGLEVGDAHDHG